MLAAGRAQHQGIYAVMVTPFTEGGDVDADGLAAHVEKLIDDGMEILVPCGNTGEFYSLSEAESKVVVRTTIEAASGRARVIVGVGHEPSAAEAATSYAADMGADAVMIHQPSHPFVTDDGIVAYYKRVAAVGLPMVPYIRSSALTDEGILRLLDLGDIPAVKYAMKDLQAFARLVRLTVDRPVVWVCGTAESWAPFFWTAGAEGFTSGLVNVTTHLSIALWDALKRADRAAAMDCWAAIRPFEELRARGGDGYNVSAVKEAMRQLGRPAGGLRPPSSPVDPGTSKAISHLLATWDLRAVAFA